MLMSVLRMSNIPSLVFEFLRSPWRITTTHAAIYCRGMFFRSSSRPARSHTGDDLTIIYIQYIGLGLRSRLGLGLHASIYTPPLTIPPTMKTIKAKCVIHCLKPMTHSAQLKRYYGCGSKLARQDRYFGLPKKLVCVGTAYDGLFRQLTRVPNFYCLYLGSVTNRNSLSLVITVWAKLSADFPPREPKRLEVNEEAVASKINTPSFKSRCWFI